MSKRVENISENLVKNELDKFYKELNKIKKLKLLEKYDIEELLKKINKAIHFFSLADKKYISEKDRIEIKGSQPLLIKNMDTAMIKAKKILKKIEKERDDLLLARKVVEKLKAQVERKRRQKAAERAAAEKAAEQKELAEAAERKKEAEAARQEAEAARKLEEEAELERARQAAEEKARLEEERKLRKNFTISIVNIKKMGKIKSVLVMYSDDINFNKNDITFFNRFKNKDYVYDVIYSHSNNNNTYYNIFKKSGNDVGYIKGFVNNVYKYLNGNEKDISEYLNRLVMENKYIKPVTIIIPLNEHESGQNGGGAYKRNYKKKLNKKNVPELRHMAKAKGINIKKKDDNGKSYYIKKADIINKLYKYKYKKNKQRGGVINSFEGDATNAMKTVLNNVFTNLEKNKRKPLNVGDITISINNVIVEKKYSIFSIYINNKKFDDDDTAIIINAFEEKMSGFELRIMSKREIINDYSYHLLNHNNFSDHDIDNLIEFIKEIFEKFGDKDNMIYYLLPELKLKLKENENKNILLPVEVKNKPSSGGSVMKKIYKEELNKMNVKELQEMVVKLGIKLIAKKDGKKYYCKKAELIKKICDNKFSKKQ